MNAKDFRRTLEVIKRTSGHLIPTILPVCLVGIVVCLSVLSRAQGPSYVFTMENIRITHTRSRHEDTVHANFALKIGNQEPQTQNRHMGDLNDGTYPVDLGFVEQITDPTTPVLFNFQVVNKGHGDTTDQANGQLTQRRGKNP